MNKKVLTFIDKLEGWKTAIKSLHWSADNMSQHKLCDDIASDIADFQDKVSEVQQGIQDKKISRNELKPTPYKVKNLKTFVKDVIKVSLNQTDSIKLTNNKNAIDICFIFMLFYFYFFCKDTDFLCILKIFTQYFIII